VPQSRPGCTSAPALLLRDALLLRREESDARYIANAADVKLRSFTTTVRQARPGGGGGGRGVFQPVVGGAGPGEAAASGTDVAGQRVVHQLASACWGQPSCTFEPRGGGATAAPRHLPGATPRVGVQVHKVDATVAYKVREDDDTA